MLGNCSFRRCESCSILDHRATAFQASCAYKYLEPWLMIRFASPQQDAAYAERMRSQQGKDLTWDYMSVHMFRSLNEFNLKRKVLSSQHGPQ